MSLNNLKISLAPHMATIQAIRGTGAIRLLLFLADHMTAGNEVRLTTREICRATGLSAAKVRKDIRKLEALHFVVRVHQGLALVDPRIAWRGPRSWWENNIVRFDEEWDRARER